MRLEGLILAVVIVAAPLSAVRAQKVTGAELDYLQKRYGYYLVQTMDDGKAGQQFEVWKRNHDGTMTFLDPVSKAALATPESFLGKVGELARKEREGQPANPPVTFTQEAYKALKERPGKFDLAKRTFVTPDGDQIRLNAQQDDPDSRTTGIHVRLTPDGRTAFDVKTPKGTERAFFDQQGREVTPGQSQQDQQPGGCGPHDKCFGGRP